MFGFGRVTCAYVPSSSMGYVTTVPHARGHPPGSAALDTGTAEMGLNTVELDAFQCLISVLEQCRCRLHFPGLPYPIQYRSYNPLPSSDGGSLGVRLLLGIRIIFFNCSVMGS